MRTLLAIVFALGLLPRTQAADPVALKASKTESVVEVKAGDLVVTRYHYGASVAKPYFWPVNAPNGISVTRDWPLKKGGIEGETVDHIHQKSMWFCHGDVIPEGLELKVRSADKRVEGVDFWSETMNHGKIVCTQVGEVKALSPFLVTVPSHNEWRTPDGVKILDEDRTISIHSLETGFLIVLDIDLHASVCPIKFGDTKEGSMGVRVHDALRTQIKDGGTVTANTGEPIAALTKDNLAVWGKPADWHDYTGKVQGQLVGIAMFDDSKNTHRALWHTRAYGLLAANPFGREKSGFPSAKGNATLASLKKDEHLKLRYGVFVHNGDAKAAQVGKVYESFTGKK